MLNWVVIGIGDITTKRVIPAILAEPRSRLYGIVTRSPGKAVGFEAERVWTDLSSALRDSTVDAVYVASPVALHAPQTIAALRAERHVLCEKPVAINYQEARTMVAAAAEARRTLGIAYYRRMYPKLARAKELVEAGAIGRPVMAWFANHYWYDESGHGPWRLDPTLAGGGPLYDIASHRIDVLNYLFGRPVKASAQISNAVHTYAVEDCATVLVEYGCGARGIVDVRWHSRVARDEGRIIGTDGEIELTPLNGPELRYGGTEEHLPAHANLHYPCVENFVSAVLEGAELRASGESSAWTDWVTEQCRKTGTPNLLY